MAKANILVAEDMLDTVIKYRDRFGDIKPQVDRPANHLQFPGDLRDLISVSVFTGLLSPGDLGTNARIDWDDVLEDWQEFLTELCPERQKQTYVVLPFPMSEALEFIDLKQVSLIPGLRLVYASNLHHASLYAIGLIEKAGRYGIYARA